MKKILFVLTAFIALNCTYAEKPEQKRAPAIENFTKLPLKTSLNRAEFERLVLLKNAAMLKLRFDEIARNNNFKVADETRDVTKFRFELEGSEAPKPKSKSNVQ